MHARIPQRQSGDKIRELETCPEFHLFLLRSCLSAAVLGKKLIQEELFMGRKPPSASLPRMNGSWTTLPGPATDCHVFFIQRANRGQTRAPSCTRKSRTPNL